MPGGSDCFRDRHGCRLCDHNRKQTSSKGPNDLARMIMTVREETGWAASLVKPASLSWRVWPHEHNVNSLVLRTPIPPQQHPIIEHA